MTPREIRIVKQSFAAVAHQSERLAGLFYANLFDLDPTFRLLLSGDLRRRGAKMIHALGLIVDGLDRLHVFAPALEALAVRHFGYGIEEAHYKVAGEALIRTGKAALGERFTPEVEQAWRTAYAELTETMVASARSELRLAA